MVCNALARRHDITLFIYLFIYKTILFWIAPIAWEEGDSILISMYRKWNRVLGVPLLSLDQARQQTPEENQLILQTGSWAAG